MKTLVIADRPPHQPIKKTLAENPDIELIITLGDLDYFSLKELIDITTIPKIGVYGNHCSGNYFNELGIMDMHLATFSFKGILFGGFEGCVRYKPDPYAKMYTQEEASELIKNLPSVQVLLCHCPPRGVNDEEDVAHQGFDATKMYCDINKPAILFHGHTYPTSETLCQKYNETKIIYVSGDSVIDLVL